jgi:hypothetical protein
VLVGPPSDEALSIPPEELDQRLHEALAQLSTSSAAAKVATDTGLSRRTVYARALELAATPEDEPVTPHDSDQQGRGEDSDTAHSLPQTDP